MEACPQVSRAKAAESCGLQGSQVGHSLAALWAGDKATPEKKMCRQRVSGKAATSCFSLYLAIPSFPHLPAKTGFFLKDKRHPHGSKKGRAAPRRRRPSSARPTMLQMSCANAFRACFSLRNTRRQIMPCACSSPSMIMQAVNHSPSRNP
jgi:hypothetical protein